MIPNIVQRLLVFTLRPYSHSPSRSGSFLVRIVRRNAGVAMVDPVAVGMFIAGDTDNEDVVSFDTK